MIQLETPAPEWRRRLPGEPPADVPDPPVLYAVLLLRKQPDDPVSREYYAGWSPDPAEARETLERAIATKPFAEDPDGTVWTGTVEQWYWRTDNLGEGWCPADGWEDEAGPVKSPPG